MSSRYCAATAWWDRLRARPSPSGWSSEGDSYLQGIMTRSLQLASPSDKLVEALRRAALLGASEFIPVVEDGAMIGILTPQSLSRAVQQIKLMRPTVARVRENSRD